MEFKGTKEKWYINRWGNVTSENEEVAYMPSATFNEINAANALLISKAPEMLEMLKKIVSLESIICLGGAIDEQYVGEEEALNIMMNEVKQLIKKATEL
jgi:hypothetical protein